VAKDLFYLPTYKNVGTLFEKIHTAKAPEAFTTKYLSDVIGLKSTNDRNLINMLKKLGFLDASGRPTDTYGLLKNKDVSGAAIAEGLRKAYAPLFEANEKANELPLDQLKGLVSQVTGTDAKGANAIAYTFNAIAKNADFSKTEPKSEENKKNAAGAGGNNGASSGGNGSSEKSPLPFNQNGSGFRSDFHFNIQVHLPANGTEETYLNIFNALRRTFS
jgi:hypothetical protein